MDMQGTPIGSSAQGMKVSQVVPHLNPLPLTSCPPTNTIYYFKENNRLTKTQNTSDPERYTNPTKEGAGAVASDSLAAESARSGGGFGANRDSNPLSVEGGKSTLTNTDTSAATTLAPAPDAAEREAKAAWSETADEAKGPGGQKYPEGAGGQPDFPGQHSLNGYAGGPTKAKEEVGGEGNYLRGPTGPSSSAGTTGESSDDSNTSGSGAKSGPTENAFEGSAPGYVASVVSEPNNSGKPKGKNITEGGFDDDPSKNASFTSEIGSEQDPGRQAELDVQKKAQSASGGTGPRQGMGESDNSQYDILETDQQL
ncbi:hypothetical protein MMC28_005796 [Mycoblastus sanguinarius]|nr:hypothetical protein [Mycoblastus sanguinarius]